MSSGLVTAAYIVAAILFIFSLAGLSKQETAKRGCYSGIAGMAVALFVTVFSDNTHGLGWIIIAMLIGAAIGIHKAKKVEMTEMPELIALLHSFVGLAAVLVGFNSYIEPGNVSHDMHTIHLVEVYLGIFIGAVTFTGSLAAFGKLNGKISSSPLQLPAKHKLNALALAVSFVLLLVFVGIDGSGFILLIMTLIALAFGWHLVASIGGADMPVVVSMLNSYSGWAAAAAGFMLSNDLLIVTGALVGSSGAILSYIYVQSHESVVCFRDCRRFRQRQRHIVFRQPRDRGIPRSQSCRCCRNAERRKQRHYHPGLRHGSGAGTIPRCRNHRAFA